MTTPLDLTMRCEVKEADVAAVRELVTKTGSFRPNEVDVAVELVEERLKQGSRSGYEFILLCEGERLIAYACYGKISVTLHSYDLYWIVVDPQQQGRGLGRRLLSEVEARVSREGGQQIVVETSSLEGYAATRRFYECCGYEQVARVSDFYAPGDDKLIYVRRLKAL
jgi:ribosomal protein S18 acetylase RimI-like enzyme